MRTSTLLTASFVALGLPFLASAGNTHARSRRGHDQVANRKRTDLPVVQLNKRGITGARATYYDTSVGLGACGNYNSPDKWTIALNSAQFGSSYPSPYCGQTITMSWGGKTATGVIQDECPTCDYGQIDLSQGLFTYFADTSVGVIYVDWDFGGSSGGGGNSGGGDSGNNGGNQQTTTQQPAWTPDPTTSTSEWKAPTTTWTPDPTTTSTWSSSSSSSSWSAPPSTTSSSAAPFSVESAAPESTASTEVDTLSQLHQIVLTLGRVVTSAASL